MRRKAAALGLILALGMGLLAGCAGKQKNRYQISWLELFDTVTTVTGFAESEAEFSKTAEEIYRELETYDHLYDIYEEYPGMVNLCTVNRHPGKTLKADRRILDLIRFGRETDALSGHRVDITFGAVLRIWHEAREQGILHPDAAALPEMKALEEAAKHTGFGVIETDEEQGTICLTDPEASLDVGAIAKGYATEQVRRTLPEGWLLSVGGNVAASGPKPDGSKWTVGIQDPAGDGEGILHKVALAAGSVVTSGDYQRYYTVAGERYPHIIDPETLMPGKKWRAVTVLAEDSGLADALSTTLFLMDREEGQALLERFGAEAAWTGPDGKTVMSPGYAERIIP